MKETKNAFDGFISRLDMHEERISKPEENRSIETSQTEMPRENRNNRTEHLRTMEQTSKGVTNTTQILKKSEIEAEETVKVVMAKNLSY